MKLKVTTNNSVYLIDWDPVNNVGRLTDIETEIWRPVHDFALSCPDIVEYPLVGGVILAGKKIGQSWHSSTIKSVEEIQ